ncbi:MAG: hypothetical protein VXW31_04115 [Planctomycetota bacterium]|nr:hypothetical protein [Planctomycetota bacterium]
MLDLSSTFAISTRGSSFRTSTQALRALAAALLGSSLCSPSFAQELSLVSVSATGQQPDQGSFDADVTADGRWVVFVSRGTNLIPDDTNGTRDIFVRNTETGEITRINTGPAGQQTDSYSGWPQISSDGRYVSYYSTSDAILEADANGFTDIYLFDRETGANELISVSSTEAQANGNSYVSRLTDDGRYVVFSSEASNLVPGDTNGLEDIFVRDRQLGETYRVSVSSSGDEGNSDPYTADISNDGRFVTFGSDATNLVAGGSTAQFNVYLHDRLTAETTLVSTGLGGQGADALTWQPRISGDGRWITYESRATDLVVGDTNGVKDVFLYDVQSGQTSRVSVNEAGEQGDDDSEDPSISDDGRYIAYSSQADNLVAGVITDGFAENVFVHDRMTGTVTLASIGPQGQVSDTYVGEPQISPEGGWVVFSTRSALVNEDLNGQTDVFIYGPLLESLAPYAQDFESLDAASPTALGDDGWKVFTNVFNPDGSYAYGYGVFDAPNGGAGWSAIHAGSGGSYQGAQAMNIYSEYGNGDHAIGNLIDALVFQEQEIGAANVGETWRMRFDQLQSPPTNPGGTTTRAFIKVLRSSDGSFAELYLNEFDTTDASQTAWSSMALDITIDAAWAGELMQFGFASLATNYEDSGRYYDNIDWAPIANPGLGRVVCLGNPTQTTSGALLTATGSAVAADNDLTLTVDGLPANQLGLFCQSPTGVTVYNPDGSAGHLCIASFEIGRFPTVLDSGAAGSVSTSIDLTALPGAAGPINVMAGHTHQFQYWTRDIAPPVPGPGVSTSTFASAVWITSQ